MFDQELQDKAGESLYGTEFQYNLIYGYGNSAEEVNARRDGRSQHNI